MEVTMNVRDLIPWGRNGGSRREPTAFGNDQTSPFLALHREVNRLFDEALRGFGSPALFNSFSSWPKLEVTESETGLRVAAELPGLDEKDVELLIQDGVLTIRGEKRSEVEDKERQYSEWSYGRFERQLALPFEVDEDKVSASFKNGVLTATLSKSAKAQASSKRIPINQSSRKAA
jgi:HSP20 family protein